MSESKFLCLIKPSVYDKRDWNFSLLYSNINTINNKTLDLRKDLQPIRNQGIQGSCAAQTASCMKEWQEKQDYKFNDYFSPQFIYNLRQNQETEGMTGRDVMKILSNYGIVTELKYPYGNIEYANLIDKNLLKEGKKHIIKNYARIYTIKDLKKSLEINGPCFIAFPVYNYGKRMWKQKKISDKQRGGHAMTVVGYNKNGFIIRNSWGENWGDKGYCIYPYIDWGCHWEIWTAIDEKTDIKRWKKIKEEKDSNCLKNLFTY